MASASFLGATVWACSSGSNTGFGSGDTSSNGNNNPSSSSSSTNNGGGSNTGYGNPGSSTTNGNTSTGGGNTSTVIGSSSTAAASSIVGGTGGTACPATTAPYNAPNCTATKVAGALPVTNCYYMGTSAKGYEYPYGDGVSTSCVDSSALCAMGAPAAAGPTFANYGSGLGINVNQASGAATGGMVVPTATGLTWGITATAAPAYGFQISVTAATGPCATTAGCCFRPTTTSGTVPWSSFTTTCYSTTDAGAGFSASDGLEKINFQAITGAAATSFDFCVTALSF